MATSFSEPKIIKIQIDYLDRGYKYTKKYGDSVYMVVNEDYYSDKNILKCEIKFRYRFRIYIHILTGDITIKDIYKEMNYILKKEFINERYSI